MDGRELRNCFGKFPTGVTVVSWFDGKVQKGITVNSFTSVSLDPPLVLVSIHKEAKACTGMKDKSFTINILSDEQESIARQFAGSKQETLEIDWDNKGISPKINGSVAWMECKPWREFEAGDHVLFIGEIQELHFEDLEALTFLSRENGVC
ncbi:flavin reductase family protein [Peribacillus simplex]|uniref:flavin reductase family protein n=1 Tax=Peribacillus simplex TaxID=1478 RepID=UPI0024C1409E|nr:flavin reductase family protein [Peribacillus simplex]WHY99812.1 flavin reductase family protein [Peribacillus simplex]